MEKRWGDSNEVIRGHRLAGAIAKVTHIAGSLPSGEQQMPLSLITVTFEKLSQPRVLS